MSSSSLGRNGTSKWRPARSSASPIPGDGPSLGAEAPGNNRHAEDEPAALAIDPDSKVYGEEVRVLLHGRRTSVYRVLFIIRRDTVHVLTVRHSATSLAEEMAEDDPDEGGEHALELEHWQKVSGTVVSFHLESRGWWCDGFALSGEGSPGSRSFRDIASLPTPVDPRLGHQPHLSRRLGWNWVLLGDRFQRPEPEHLEPGPFRQFSKNPSRRTLQVGRSRAS